jgi:lysophospholipase L1-like esterase
MTKVNIPGWVASANTTFALLGDSITENNEGGPGLQENPTSPTTGAIFQATGYWTWANIYLQQRATLLYNAGRSNATTQTIIETHLPIVLSLNPLPTYCICMGGINDIQASGLPGATIVANMETICKALINAGVIPVVCTLAPAGATVLNTSAKYEAYYDTQRGILNIARKLPVLLCNWTAAAAGVNSAYRTNYSLPGELHPSTTGAQALGRVLANVLNPYLSPNDAGSDPPMANNDYKELTNNALMTTSEAISTKKITGTVAKGYTATWSGTEGTAALSMVARTDAWSGMGTQWQQITISEQGSKNLQFFWNGGITTGFSAGQTVEAGIDFQTDADWANCAILTFQLIAYTTAYGSKLFTADACSQGISTSPMLSAVQSGRFTIPKFVIPATTAILQPQVVFQGTGTVRVGRLHVKAT